MASTDPLDLSAGEQAELIRTKQLSVRELVALSLARIDALQPTVGAFITVDHDHAMAAAKDADKLTMFGGQRGPLHGVPAAVKDLMRTRGLRTTWGSLVHEHHVPDADAPAVDRLRQAGAIIVGKANTSEFGLGAETWTKVGPRACNPYDLTRTTGGSSGGTAAAIAARMCSIGLGSDAGGSIRLPGAWCGVAGLKPTYGRVPVECSATLADHPSETIGPMGRTVADLALAMDVLAGWHPNDPVSSRTAVPRHRAALDSPRSTVRVGYSDNFGMGDCDASIRGAVLATAHDLTALGYSVEASDFKPPGRHPFLVMFDLIAGASYGRLEQYANDSYVSLCAYSQEFLRVGAGLSAADYTRAVYEAKQVRHALDLLLDRFDVVILPATAVVAWPHDTPPTTVAGRAPAEFGGITYGGLPYLALASITGHPAMTVPTGIDADGMPLAVQLIGRWFEEPTLLQVAGAIEQARGVLAAPPL